MSVIPGPTPEGLDRLWAMLVEEYPDLEEREEELLGWVPHQVADDSPRPVMPGWARDVSPGPAGDSSQP